MSFTFAARKPLLKMKQVYILDDETPIMDPLRIWFERQQFKVATFETTYDFLNAMMKEKPCIVLMDIRLIEDDGRTVCSLVKSKYKSSLPVILISAIADFGKDYQQYDADAFIAKPFTLSTLRKVLEPFLTEHC